MDISYENRVDTLHIWRRHTLQWVPHFHDSIELVCLLSGRAEMLIDGETYLLSAGDVAVAMPNVLHGYYREADVDAFLLIVPRHFCSAYAPMLESHTVKTPIVRAAVQDGRLTGRIRELIDVHKSALPFREEIREGLFTVLFGELFACTGMTESRKMPEEIERRLIAYCFDNFTQEISLDSLADALHVSRSYISYIFSNKLHVSLPDFIGSLRIAEARRQIEHGACITDAAFGAGFSSVRTFNRRFVKECGETPSDFKRRCAEEKRAQKASETA